jgi:hypothetical protein
MVLGHGLALAAVLAAGPAVGVPLVLGSLLGAAARVHRPLGHGSLALRFEPRAGWQVVGMHGVPRRVELAGASVVTRAAVFLRWREGRVRRGGMLMTDSFGEEDWRRLRVLLRFHDGPGSD